MPDDQLDCHSQFKSCGNKVTWHFVTKQDGTPNTQSNIFSISRIRFHRTSTWHDVLHNLAIKNVELARKGEQKLKIRHNQTELEYVPNFDDFFNDICPDNRYNCNCHNHYLELKSKHGVSSSMYVNVLDSKCDHQNEYVHSSINIGKGTVEECMSMFRYQIQNDTFEYKDEGGPHSIKCAGEIFTNVNRNQSKLLKKGTHDIQVSTFLYVILVIFFSIIFLTIVFLLLKNRKKNRKQIKEKSQGYK